jgi:hypothetical protein
MFDEYLKMHGDISPQLLTFLSQEEAFFSGALRRSKNAPMDQRELWRKETVYQRRLRVSREVFEMMGGEVRYGPLKGLRLSDDAWWGAPDKASMLLGLYEQELLTVLCTKPLTARSNFIDIGAADGYYAIGLVMAGFYKKSFCFEISEKGRETIKYNAGVNGVASQVEVFGKADETLVGRLSQDQIDDSVVLVDIEGGEFDVLSEAFLQSFQHAYILIEIHNWVEDFEKKYLKLLLAASKYFFIDAVKPVNRDLTQFTELNDFTDDNRYLICSEGRPNVMRFLRLNPKSAQPIK